MIVRILTARIKAAKVSQLNALMRVQLDLIRHQPGSVYVKLARRLDPDGSEEIMLFEEWRDPDSVYAWAGRDLTNPRFVEGTGDAIVSAQVLHYEVLEAEEPTEFESVDERVGQPAENGGGDG